MHGLCGVRRLFDADSAVELESGGSLRLFTFKSNSKAQRFYERHGFKIIGRGFEELWQLEDIEYQWCRA